MQLIKNERDNSCLAAFVKWTFEPTGDFVEDCAAGRRLASDFLAFQSEPVFAPSLGWVVQSIADLDRSFSGLEVGFFHELNTYLASAVVPVAAPTLRVIPGGQA